MTDWAVHWVMYKLTAKLERDMILEISRMKHLGNSNAVIHLDPRIASMKNFWLKYRNIITLLLAVEAFVLWSISAYHRDIFNYLRITLHQVDERTRIYIYDGYNYDVWIFAFFVGMIGIVINQELQWKGKFVVSFVFVLMHICLMFLRYSIVPWNK